MIHERIATNVGPAALDIAWAELGDRAHPTVLLVMGLAAQLVNWPRGLLDALVARDLHVVIFDNRDSGRSSHLINAARPDLPATLRGDFSSVSYTLTDMAADSVGLLDVLQISTAHAVGASMGAGIAQLMAVQYPDRISSLTSMMWTTGAPEVGQVHPRTAQQLFSRPFPRTREEHIAATLHRHEVLGSPEYPIDHDAVAETAGLTFDRGYDEMAIARQAVATVASGDRTQTLRNLRVPTLVVHGLADTMCDPSGGHATAAAIAGARLVTFEGMGHTLPAPLWDPIAAHIADIVAAGETARQSARAQSAGTTAPRRETT